MISDLTKLVALAAVLTLGCTDSSDPITVPGPPVPPPPRAFTAGGDWNVRGVSEVSYRFWSYNDGETGGDFTGAEYSCCYYYYYGYYVRTPVSGHWEDNTVTFTVGSRAFSGKLSRDNPTAVDFALSSGGSRTLER